MTTSLRSQILIVAVAAASYFTALGSTWLWDEDEAFFATAAAEMHRHNDWIVPTFNEELFAHKPPFMYWMMRLGYLMFGVNELGARFFSGVFGAATAVLVFHIGRRLYSERAGLIAGVALATCLMWSVVSRASTADAYLGFFIAASLLVYIRAVFDVDGDFAGGLRPAQPALREAVLDRWLPKSWWTFAAMYALMALAVLVKGPIGVLLPGATIGLFLLLQMPIDAPLDASRFRSMMARIKTIVTSFPQTFWRMRPLTAIAAILLIAGPWFVAVGLKTDGAFLREFFGVHNFGRFLKPMENHRGPLFYYIPVIAIGFFPWSIFAIPTAIEAALSQRSRTATKLVACWAGWMIGFFSIASTKLPNYVLPAYPALALLTASWLDAWLARRETTASRWPKLAFGTLAAVGLLLTIGVIVGATVSSGGKPLLVKLGVNSALAEPLKRLVWLGAVPLVAGLAAWRLAARDRRSGAVWTMSAASAVFTASVLIVAAGIMNPLQTSAPITEAVPESSSAAAIGSFRHSPPSLIFYAARHVDRLKTAEDASEWLNTSEPRTLVTTDAGLKQIQEMSDRPIRVIESRPRFPRTGEVVLIGNEQVETGSPIQRADANAGTVR